MKVSGYLVDWVRLQEHLAVHGTDMTTSTAEWFRGDSFTAWNDSYHLSREIGGRFLDILPQLSADVGTRVGRFLAVVCPTVSLESDFDAPMDLDITPEWFFTAASPNEVRDRLALLDEVFLPHVFTLYHAQFMADGANGYERALVLQREVVEYFFMWAAAMGQAVRKGWGLVVSLD